MIPTTYQEWRHCIEVHCGIPLTPEFMHQRLLELDDSRNFRTEQFTRIYGDTHRRHVMAWFQQALDAAA